MADQFDHDVELDARGMACPIPLIQTKLMLNGMQPGEVIKVIATDAGTVRDFHAHCRLAGHEVIKQTEEGPLILHWIRRG